LTQIKITLGAPRSTIKQAGEASITCKGCGLCVSECPCGANKMVPEEI